MLQSVGDHQESNQNDQAHDTPEANFQMQPCYRNCSTEIVYYNITSCIWCVWASDSKGSISLHEGVWKGGKTTLLRSSMHTDAPSLPTSFGFGGATRRKIGNQNCARDNHVLGCGRQLGNQSPLSHTENSLPQICSRQKPRGTQSSPNHPLAYSTKCIHVHVKEFRTAGDCSITNTLTFLTILRPILT